MPENKTSETMLKFESPKDQASIIKVIGVGGGGGNAVNYMYNQGITGVDFIICNTDAQALDKSPVPVKIQLGAKGLGAGSIPNVAREAARECADTLKEALAHNTKMLFITAGMGGGTGTGAAPVIAEIARELDILTVGIITLPFNFEGRKRALQAEQGIKEMLQYVDSIIIIYNEKLRELYGNLTISEAFKKADDVLLTAAKGIAEIITVDGYINTDFEDINTVMQNSGGAIMGSGEAEGENRAIEAVESALRSPLLNDASIKGAKSMLLYLTSGTEELRMDEVTEITDHIQYETGEIIDIIWGNGYDENLGKKIKVTIIATGFETNSTPHRIAAKPVEKKVNVLTHEVVEPAPTAPTEVVYEKPELPLVEPSPISLAVEPLSFPAPPVDSMEDIINFTLYTAPSENRNTEPKDELTPSRSHQNPEVSTQEALNPHLTFATSREPVFEEEDREVTQRAKERKDRLRQFSSGLKTAEGLEQIEKIPAYQRSGIVLSEVKPSNESEISKYSLSQDENNQMTIQTNNSFLHDNPD